MTILHEAATFAPDALTGKSWRVKLIEGDKQGASAFYPKGALESGKALFKKGTRIYADHRGDGERPERSIRNLIGWFTEDASYDGKDLNTNVSFVESERERIKELAEAGVIGMSISAEGKFEKGSSRRLAAFTKVHSVDVVTVPGAGGAFKQMLESEGSDGTAVPGSQKEESMDPKELAAALAEALAPKFAELTEALKPAVKPLEEAKPAEKTKAPLKEFMAKLDEAELTKTAREAVIAVFEADGDFAAAIASETARDAEIREAAKTSFKGAVHVEESDSKTLEEALKGVFA